jgi:N-methylhydantoinase B
MDALELEVARHALSGIAEEMGAALQRTAHSPNITERRDFSCALADPEGEMCAQAEHIPVHLGSMPASIKAAIDTLVIQEGDAVILNDPFAGGTHLPDVTLVSSVFRNARLVGYVANRAHHADVGGSAPGSMPGLSSHIDEEGHRMEPTLAWKGGSPQRGVIDAFVSASRSPSERLGDLRAQWGANVTGARRLLELDERMGARGLGQAMAALIEYSERTVRAGISSLPDGVWEHRDAMDSSAEGGDPVSIAVSVQVEGDSLTVDFSSSDPQVAGNVNTVLSVAESCVAYVVRCLVAPDVPPTAGAMRPVRVVAPEGTVISATYPAAVSAGNVETSQRIVDVLMGAFAKAVPGRVPAASQGTMNNLLIGGKDFAYYETIAGGEGGTPSRAGMDGVHTHMTNTLNTPVEAIEYNYPLRVVRYGLREGSGGEGKFPGGLGIRRDVEILATDAEVSLQTERRASRPPGRAGGGPGASGENVLISPDGAETPLPDKTTIGVKKGDIISIRTPGGGGYGST